MNKLTVVLVAGFGLVGAWLYFLNNNEPVPAGDSAGMTAAAAAHAELPSLDDQWEFIFEYCVDCHNESDYTGGLSLEYAFPDQVPMAGRTWEAVIKKLATRQMPPQGEPQPGQEEREVFVASLERVFDELAEQSPNPGAPVLPRLNRTEYANVIRDVLGLEVDASRLLPADDSAGGFDNMSSALTVSPTLLEGFLAASGRVAALAVGDMNMQPDFVTYRTRPDQSQDSHVPGAPLGTMGGLVFEHYFPLDGEYEFHPTLYGGTQGQLKGLEFPHVLEITINRERVFVGEFGGYEDNKLSHENSTLAGENIHERLKSRHFVPAGMHTVTVNFLGKPPAQSAEIWRQYQRTVIDANEDKGMPHLDKVDILGPYNAVSKGNTAPREKIFICEPGQFETEARACATQILSNLARQAYRRPVTENEVTDLLDFFDSGNEIGGFDKGIETGIRRIISGPEFIFRAEAVPAGVEPGTAYNISDLELASRLSFFIWSSVPDEELLQLAIRDELSEPAVLESQVRRMLADPKADNLTSNFGSQWLTLRNLDGIVPDPDLFPDYDNNLRAASVLETQLLFRSIVEEDRNVLDLLSADYTYVNERLAQHYGMRGIYGSRMRRVPVQQEERLGVLGHSSIQTLTSISTRTSAVNRGQWVLENLMATPAPPPPPDVPALEASAGDEPSTLREQLVLHRADPVCSACHELMDPVGYALENFDAVGRYRLTDINNLPIDASDVLFDGTPIDGVNGLRNFLLDNEEIFIHAMTEKLLQFALARPVEYFDMPAIRKIAHQAAENDNRFSSLVLGVVNSTPFRMRMNDRSEESLALNR